MTTTPQRAGLPTAPVKNPAPVTINPNTIAQAVSAQVATLLAPHLEELEETITTMNSLANRVSQENERIAQRLHELETKQGALAQAIAKNDAILQENARRAAEANKALDLMKLAAEMEQEEMVERLEIERLTKELTERKKNLNAMEDSITDRYERKRAALEAGRGQYFPELSQELERLIAQAKEGEEAPQVQAPDLEARRPLSPEEVSTHGES